MKFQDASELVVGLALNQRLNPQAIDVSIVMDPYNKIVMGLQAGQTIPEMIDVVGLQPVQTCMEAAETVGNKVPIDWAKVLELAHARESAAVVFERQAKNLRKGEDVDGGIVAQTMERLTSGKFTFSTLDKIDPDNAVWQPTYYDPIDRHIGGLPQAGLTIIGAPPGVGKTSLLLKILVAMAKAGEETALFSLEMTNGQILRRLLNQADVSKEELSRITCEDSSLNIDEITAGIARLKSIRPGIKIIGVDFADLILEDKDEEANVSVVYRRLAKLAKTLRVCIVLLSQLSREYVDGIPRVHHIRWSGLAEALGSLILLIYNPKQTWTKFGKDERLPLIPGRGYVIMGKSRFGTIVPGRGIGAIPIEWDGISTWGDTAGDWHDLS